MIGIYKITNKINGHCYVGQSIDICRRWKDHIRCKKDYPLYRAFNKYGVDNFSFEILKICDKKDLIYWERKFYNMLKPEYNQIYPNENPVFNEEIERKRQAIFQTEEYKNKKRIPMKQEIKNKVSQSLKNSIKHKLSHNTQEYKDKMRLIRNKGLRADKPVIMFNNSLCLEFDSMTACAKWLTANTKYVGKNKVSKIKDVCDGVRKTAYGFYYSYK